MLTIEHDWTDNILKVVTDSTVTPLDFEDALDLLTDLQHYTERMEEREIELDKHRYSDEYGDGETAWRQ
ncbi:hypothetical protein [Brevibacterium oceani]|uniref:hypothetical protein n=1 Tax=Brevibacterium oceani TaxID=358099 RepID=UPI0015E7734A|nr:hypothetical protein [Brevibacterium oceani]